MNASDGFFLYVYILGPLILLVVLWYLTKFPISMAFLLFLLGPFAGTCALCVIAEESKPSPMTENIPGAILFTYLVIGLPIFGLWVAGLGTIGWWCIRQIRSIGRLGAKGKMFASIGLGTAIGPILVFALSSLFSFDPNWPNPDRIWRAIHDPVSVFSIIMQGVLAGAVCGVIVGYYADYSHEQLP